MGKNIEDIDEQLAKLAIEKSITIDKQLRSNNINNIFKAQKYIESQNKQQTPTAFLFDPYEPINQNAGFKQTRKRVSFEVLKKIGDTPIINTVFNTRLFQIQNFLKFTLDEKEEGYTVRKKRGLFDEGKGGLSNSDKKVIEKINGYLCDGGFNKKWDLYNDDLLGFSKKIIRDSLNYDQLAFECQRNRRFELIGHRAIDASTIRLLETIDPRYREQESGKYEEQYGYLPIYAQVFQSNIITNQKTNEQILYYPWELGYANRNQSTDISKNGYGTSELEVILDMITWSLWGMQYNGNFFKQGSNPKGFINIKDSGSNQDLVNDFRQTWRQMIAGVNNCVHGDTNIITIDGCNKISDFFIKDKEDKFIKIWDGEEFINGRIYISGDKKLNLMKLNNGIEIKTSSNHKFKVINSNTGLPEWKERQNIQIGDYLLTNKISINNDNKPIYYKDKLVEKDLFEVLGWAIGDGWFGSDENRLRRMSLFYHQIKERDVLQRHFSILEKYGINCMEKEKIYTEKEISSLKEKNGFKSVAKSNVKINIFDADFMRFIFDLGFKSSNEGKQIPKFLYSYNNDCKCSFLKGFFSADGHVAGGRYIQMSITSDILREQTKQLLLTEGIRCAIYEGNIRPNTHFGSLKAGYLLLIKDNKEFFEKIGMIQSHKQYKQNKTNNYNIKNSFPPETAKYIIKEIKQLLKDDKTIVKTQYDIGLISGVLTGKDTISYEKLIQFANKFNYQLPDFILNYNFDKVIQLEESVEIIEMYDIEMFNEKHQFIANGILTHNSHKIPIFSGIDLQWIDLQSTNKDMEFQQWMEFLIILICSSYTIDPSELGFSFQKAAQVFGQDGQKERLTHSKKKGLVPLLRFLEKVINKYLVSELDETFEFIFTGINIEDETAVVDLDSKRLSSGMVSFESIFEKNMGRPYDKKKDTILNPVFLQMKQMEQYGGQGSNEEVDEMTGEAENGTKNPFEDFEDKSLKSNPIMQECYKYIDKNIDIKNN
jgi:intein/homing endonuclease